MVNMKFAECVLTALQAESLPGLAGLVKHYSLYQKVEYGNLDFIYVISIFLAYGERNKTTDFFYSFASSLTEILITTEMVDYVRCKY